jgi:hypothetical protein
VEDCLASDLEALGSFPLGSSRNLPLDSERCHAGLPRAARQGCWEQCLSELRPPRVLPRQSLNGERYR